MRGICAIHQQITLGSGKNQILSEKLLNKKNYQLAFIVTGWPNQRQIYLILNYLDFHHTKWRVLKTQNALPIFMVFDVITVKLEWSVTYNLYIK